MPLPTGRIRTVWGLALGLGLLGGVATVVMVNAAIPARASDMALAFPAFGGVVGLVAAVGLWRASRGAAGVGRVVLAMFSFAGVAMLVGSALLGINKLTDGSPATLHTAKIVKKYAPVGRWQGGDVDDYSVSHDFVSVTSWLDDGKLIKVYVTHRDAVALQVGDAIAIPTHEGRLGWPWVEPYRAR